MLTTDCTLWFYQMATDYFGGDVYANESQAQAHPQKCPLIDPQLRTLMFEGHLKCL